MKFSSKLTGFLVIWIIIMAGGASALAIPNQREGDTILPPNFEYGQGPEIAGEIYPPFGDQQSKVSSRPDPRSSHSPYPSTQGFDYTPQGSIDMRINSDPEASIYAGFDSTITYLNENTPHSKGGSSAQVIAIYSSSSKNEARYAHIIINKDILNNYKNGIKIVKRGQLIGRVATPESARGAGIYDFSMSPHLHFQLWLNGVEAEYAKMHKWSY